MYNAVVTSKLLYGLENLEATDTANNIINTFQLKGLRKILQKTTTYIDRENTNEEIYRLANLAISEETVSKPKIIPLSKVLEEKKLRLLGHVLRRDWRHPQFQVTFTTYKARIRTTTHRRRGRPRINWTRCNLQKAWTIMRQCDQSLDEEFDFTSSSHRQKVLDHAHAYAHPFTQKQYKPKAKHP